MSKVVILYNPSSGGGRSIREKPRIEKILADYAIDYDLIITRSEDHMRELCPQLAKQYQTIVGVGGDTTFTIIATELIKFKKLTDRQIPSLGMIGTGSANDILRSLGLLKVEEVCQAIQNRKTAKMDIGQISISGRREPIFFLGSLSIGLGAMVNQYIAGFKRQHSFMAKNRLTGQTMAGILGINNAFKTGEVPITVQLECAGSVHKVRFSLLVFLNTNRYANGLNLSASASPFDGKFDCCIVKTKSFFNTVKFTIRVMRNQPDNHELDIIKSESFKISCDTPLAIQADGEVYPDVASFTVSVLPAELTIISSGDF